MESRPKALTALILVFEIVAVGAFLLGGRGMSGDVAGMPRATALLLMLTFASSAAVAFGLHGRRGWSRHAARVWMGVVAALCLWLFLGPPHGLPLPPLAALPIGLALVAFCVWVERYLPTVLRPTH